MNTETTVNKGESNIPRAIAGLFVLLGTAILIALFGLFAYFLGSRAYYFEQAFPGVHIRGVDLGGMDHEEIVAVLQENLTYPLTGTIVLSDGEQMWTATPVELGAFMDFNIMAQQAIAVGRSGNVIDRLLMQIESWYGGYHLPAVVVFDHIIGNHFLHGLGQEIDQPTVEATIRLRGTDVETTTGQIGRTLNIAATLETLEAPVAAMIDAEIPLIIDESPPSVLDASNTAEKAGRLLSESIKLTADGFEGISLSPEDVASLLRFELIDGTPTGTYDISMDPVGLRALLQPVGPDLERKAANARFIFNDDTGELDLLEPAVIGRTLILEETIDAINESIETGEHEFALVFEIDPPEVGDHTTATELGISEPVSVVSSYFNGSSSARIQNIKTASSAFHGLLIPPGGSLSMAEVLGDISLDNGYAEALIIYGDKTIKGVGGGVCQVSTTLFRTAFFGGLEIEERHPHAYRVGYYEQGPGSPGPGLDATVFVPVVDFIFTNDTSNWLLSETYIYGTQLLWKFYSTSDDRVVDWSRQISKKVDAPKPLYKENPDLDKGELKQIDYEADGMDVVVYRVVTLEDAVLHEDIIKTHYLPWQEIWEFGPGTELPDDVEVEES